MFSLHSIFFFSSLLMINIFLFLKKETRKSWNVFLFFRLLKKNKKVCQMISEIFYVMYQQSKLNINIYYFYNNAVKKLFTLVDFFFFKNTIQLKFIILKYFYFVFLKCLLFLFLYLYYFFFILNDDVLKCFFYIYKYRSRFLYSKSIYLVNKKKQHFAWYFFFFSDHQFIDMFQEKYKCKEIGILQCISYFFKLLKNRLLKFFFLNKFLQFCLFYFFFIM